MHGLQEWRVEPFDLWHLGAIELNAEAKELFSIPGFRETFQEVARQAEAMGTAYSCLVAGEPVFCGGLQPYFRVAHFWSIASPALLGYALPWVRATRTHIPALMETFGFSHAVMNVRSSDVKAAKHAKLVGFHKQAERVVVGPDTEEYDLWVVELERS